MGAVHVGQNQHNPIMAVKAAKKTQNPKKTQSAKKTPTPKKSTSPKKAQTKKDKKVVKNKKPNPIKDVVPSETPETTEISETPQDSTINTTSVKVDTTKESPKRTKRTLEDLVGSENIITTCELAEEQVVKAVSAAFKAYEVSQKKTENQNLFDDEPEPVNLLVSAIKIPQGEPVFFSTKLPNSFLKRDNDICLIVKDLEKGWKKDHEPTIHHYKELLQKKDIDFVNEILPLRQLRVEYKPFEARGKLSKLYDIVLVDKRVLKYVPRYLGKSFYQSGKFPISFDLEAKDLASEFQRALSTSLMSMSNKGSSYQIQVGLSNQTEKEIEENIAAVYSSLLTNFPGTFANVRSLALRFGTRDWTIPIYISCANQDSVTLPPPRTKSEPLVDDLTTLQPGFKVAVYPSGQVTVIEDENYQAGVLDQQNKTKRKKKGKQAEKKETTTAESIEELAVADDSEAGESGDEETAAVSDDDDDEVKKVVKAKKKSKAEDSSEDEGDALENEYMKELELMEGEENPEKQADTEVEAEDDENQEEDDDEEEEEAPPAKRSKVLKANKKPAGKKSKKAVKSKA